jgi:hypothetical protein
METIIAISIPLIVSFFVVRDAKSRGMSAGLWGVFVFFLLIIGLPAYFIFRKPKLKTTQDNFSSREVYILNDLREKDILSEEEYQQKLKILEDSKNKTD